MCIKIIERYAQCRCIYYSHAADFCGAKNSKGHKVKNREVLVGYTCSTHSLSKGQSSGRSKGIDSGYSSYSDKTTEGSRSIASNASIGSPDTQETSKTNPASYNKASKLQVPGPTFPNPPERQTEQELIVSDLKFDSNDAMSYVARFQEESQTDWFDYQIDSSDGSSSNPSNNRIAIKPSIAPDRFCISCSSLYRKSIGHKCPTENPSRSHIGRSVELGNESIEYHGSPDRTTDTVRLNDAGEAAGPLANDAHPPSIDKYTPRDDRQEVYEPHNDTSLPDDPISMSSLPEKHTKGADHDISQTHRPPAFLRDFFLYLWSWEVSFRRLQVWDFGAGWLGCADRKISCKSQSECHVKLFGFETLIRTVSKSIQRSRYGYSFLTIEKPYDKNKKRVRWTCVSSFMINLPEEFSQG